MSSVGECWGLGWHRTGWVGGGVWGGAGAGGGWWVAAWWLVAGLWLWPVGLAVAVGVVLVGKCRIGVQ